MKQWRAALPAMVLVAMLAGCAGSDDAPTSLKEEDSTDAPSPASVPSPSGSVAVEGPGRAVVEPVNGTNESLPVTVPLSFDGKLGTRLYVCPPAVECEEQEVSPADRWLLPEFNGTPVEFALTLTWDPVNAAMTHLRVGYQRCPGECDGNNAEMLGFADGPSPLTYGPVELDWPPGDSIQFFVWVPSLAPGPVGAYLTTDQPFHLEGTLTARPER